MTLKELLRYIQILKQCNSSLASENQRLKDENFKLRILLKNKEKELLQNANRKEEAPKRVTEAKSFRPFYT